jgi:hypothetical protein
MLQIRHIDQSVDTPLSCSCFGAICPYQPSFRPYLITLLASLPLSRLPCTQRLPHRRTLLPSPHPVSTRSVPSAPIKPQGLVQALPLALGFQASQGSSHRRQKTSPTFESELLWKILIVRSYLARCYVTTWRKHSTT